MGRNTKITVAAILSLVIAGCASEETPVAVNSTPIPKAAVSNTAVPNAASNSPTATPSFPNPVVSANPVLQTTVPTPSKGLIQPTNADLRRDMLSKGRTDPFAQIGGQIVPDMIPNNKIVKPVPPLPRLPIQPTVIVRKPQPTVIVRKPQPTVIVRKPQQNLVAQNSKLPSPSILPKVLPQVVPNPGLSAVLQPVEKPDLARAILVTGIVQIGKEPQAIIKVPDEPTSRYVQAGQRLVNGVLVKRIEMNQGSNPVLILEQYGIEVARMVGEAPVDAKPSTTASAVSLLPNDQAGIN